MKNSVCNTNILVFIFSLLIAFPAGADVIHLKNGRNMEGVVEKEDDARIFVNVGFGLIGINRQDILSIDKSSKQDLNQLKGKWSKEYFNRPEFTPGGLEDVSQSYNELEKARKEAMDSRTAAEGNQVQAQNLDEDFQGLKKTAESFSQRLSEARIRNDVTAYNNLVSDYNAVNARIQLNRIKFDDLNKSMVGQEKPVSDYSKALRVFKDLLEQKKTPEILEDTARKYFIEQMEALVNRFDSDFSKYSAGYSQANGSMMVEVLINQRIRARLVVDTGASLVVISQRIANQLVIKGFDRNNFFYTTVADGSKVKAYPVLLEDLKVGNAVMRNVQAAVLEENGVGIGDGLLGMSFLSNFALEIDAKSNSIVLREFKAQ